MDTNFEQKVRERAYAIWISAGMEDGMAHDHWVAAEKAMKSETAVPAPAKKKAKTAKAETVKATTAAPKKAAAKNAAAKKAAPKASAKDTVSKAVVAKAKTAKPASELRH